MAKTFSASQAIKIGKILGGAATVISLAFLARKLLSQIDGIKALSCKQACAIALTALVHVATLMLFSFAWMKLLSIFGAREFGWRSLNKIYAKSNLLKYIPGNVFQYIGRNQLAISCQISHADVILSSALEIVCTICAAILFSIIMSSRLVFALARQYATRLVLPALIMLFVVAAAIIAIKKIFWQKLRGYVLARVDALKKAGAWRTLCCVVGIYSLVFAILGGAFILTIRVHSGAAMPALQVPSVMAAYAFSWLLGFITPGSPAGLGIRELILLSFLSRLGISDKTASFSIVVARAGNMLGDVFAYIIACAMGSKAAKGQGEKA